MTNGEQLAQIRARALQDTSLHIPDGGKNLVFGKGNPQASILYIGEAPGEQEDIQGIPFVGRAGKELDKLLRTINLTIDDVYIANILKYRPPGNRDPTEEEIRKHTPYLVEQIKAIQPKIICTLGNFSTKFVLAGFNVDGMKAIPGVAALHGKERTITVNGYSCLIVPLYHPAAMLYKPALRGETEQDFLHLGRILGQKRTTLLDY